MAATTPTIPSLGSITFAIAKTTTIRVTNTQESRTILLGDTELVVQEASSLEEFSPPITAEIYTAWTALDQHLKLAATIQDYVHQRIFFSTNYQNRICILPEEEIARPEDLMAVIRDIRAGKTPREQLELSLRYKTGNCEEMVRVGLQCPAIQDTYAETMGYQAPGDHLFLVIGRDPTTPPKIPEEWNRDAVICDVWAGTYFPGFAAEQHLIYFCGMVQGTDSRKPAPILMPSIRLYDPDTDVIAIGTLPPLDLLLPTASDHLTAIADLSLDPAPPT